MKNNKVKFENDVEQKICKTCGDPLSSKSKYKYCENCRRERAKARKEAGGAAIALLSLAVSCIPIVKHFNKK